MTLWPSPWASSRAGLSRLATPWRAAFQTAINDGFAKLTTELQQERDTLRQELVAERVSRAAKEAELHGAILNLTQTVESLKALLRRNGIPVPEAQQPPTEFIELEGGQ